jgi:hypothetical protein
LDRIAAIENNAKRGVDTERTRTQSNAKLTTDEEKREEERRREKIRQGKQWRDE